MEKEFYDEMISGVSELDKQRKLNGKKIYLFGHCSATEQLADCLISRGLKVSAILDNNKEKYGKRYREIEIVPPETVINEIQENTIVCIVTRFYESMKAQLRSFGFKGAVYKLVDYNTYSDYSLTEETLKSKKERVGNGEYILRKLEEEYHGCFRIFCPFAALGDICIMMSYLPYFARERRFDDFVIIVSDRVLAKVVNLFGGYHTAVLLKQELDSAIQAVICTNDRNSFIAHQDRPYIVNLHRALYIKCIPLTEIYRAGVFGLDESCIPYKPENWKIFDSQEKIVNGGTVILSPYAKSVTLLPNRLWSSIIRACKEKGLKVLTNVHGSELPLEGTEAVSPEICELKSAVEQAGTFIGIRSGLCDVIQNAECRKIALYPDYNYSDTIWKAIDMYYLDQFDKNIVIYNNCDINGIVNEII
jgi:hypothetical protein